MDISAEILVNRLLFVGFVSFWSYETVRFGLNNYTKISFHLGLNNYTKISFRFASVWSKFCIVSFWSEKNLFRLGLAYTTL